MVSYGQVLVYEDFLEKYQEAEAKLNKIEELFEDLPSVIKENPEELIEYWANRYEEFARILNE